MAKDNQGNILRATSEDKASQATMIRKMKSDLTATSFKLGELKKNGLYFKMKMMVKLIVKMKIKI